MDDPRKVFELNFLKYLVLQEVSSLKTVQQIRDDFIIRFSKNLSKFPELGLMFGIEDDQRAETPFVLYGGSATPAQRKSVEKMYRFVDNHLLELRYSRQIYIIEPFNIDSSFRIGLDSGSLLKFVNDCSNFMLYIQSVDESQEESVKGFIYNLLPFMQVVFSPRKMFELAIKGTTENSERWAFYLNLFLLYCNLKGKLHTVTEHYYLNKIPKEVITDTSFKLSLAPELVSRFVGSLLNRTRKREELLEELGVDSTTLDNLLKALQVHRINF